MGWQMVDPFNPPASIWSPWVEVKKIVGLRHGLIESQEDIRASLDIAQMGLCCVCMREKKL